VQLFVCQLLLNSYLAVFKSFTSVQLVPFQDSVAAIAARVLFQQKLKHLYYLHQLLHYSLPVFKSLTVVQLVPFQDSVPTLGADDPPKAKA
jgi:hypothetical protein